QAGQRVRAVRVGAHGAAGIRTVADANGGTTYRAAAGGRHRTGERERRRRWRRWWRTGRSRILRTTTGRRRNRRDEDQSFHDDSLWLGSIRPEDRLPLAASAGSVSVTNEIGIEKSGSPGDRTRRQFSGFTAQLRGPSTFERRRSPFRTAMFSTRFDAFRRARLAILGWQYAQHATARDRLQACDEHGRIVPTRGLDLRVAEQALHITEIGAVQ